MWGVWGCVWGVYGGVYGVCMVRAEGGCGRRSRREREDGARGGVRDGGCGRRRTRREEEGGRGEDVKEECGVWRREDG